MLSTTAKEIIPECSLKDRYIENKELALEAIQLWFS